MVIVGPEYLSYMTLPSASDILYHGNLVYFLPTGFSKYEYELIAGFLRIVRKNNIFLPSFIWEMRIFIMIKTR